MYRILILVSAFLLTVSGVLFLQGETLRNPPELADARTEVTVTEVEALSTSATQPPPSEPSVGAQALAAAEAATSASISARPDARPEAGLVASVGQDGTGGAEPTADASSQAAMAAMTAEVLAGIQAQLAPGGAATPPVAQSAAPASPAAFIDRLLNDAAANGLIAVPQALMTSDGKVDTAALLSAMGYGVEAITDSYTAALIVEANAGSASVAPAAPAAASATGARVHVVEPGDSLALIAVKYFRTPDAANRIFEANRDQLASPDRISVGQRLVIPN